MTKAMKTKFYGLLMAITIGSSFIGCDSKLDVTPVSQLPDDIVYSDKSLALSVLANFYISVNYGQNNGDYGSYHLLDEANNQYGSPTTTDDEKQINRNFYRTFDYALVRRMNQFLEGIRSNAAKSALVEKERADLESQCIFLRAWYYFCMTRSLGGMPIVGDDVYVYEAGMDPE